MNRIFKFLCQGSIIKTLRLNLHYFGINALFRPRIAVARNVKFGALKGTIECPNSLGCCNLGFFKNNGYPLKKGKTYFSNEGSLKITKHLCLGYGASMLIHEKAVVSIVNCSIGEFSIINISNGLIIGDKGKISWDVQIMDHDSHKILDMATNKAINDSKPIVLGDNVWLCSKSLVMKNAHIMENSILACGSFVSKPIDEPNCLIVANEVKKRNITSIDEFN